MWPSQWFDGCLTIDFSRTSIVFSGFRAAPCIVANWEPHDVSEASGLGSMSAWEGCMDSGSHVSACLIDSAFPGF